MPYLIAVEILLYHGTTFLRVQIRNNYIIIYRDKTKFRRTNGSCPIFYNITIILSYFFYTILPNFYKVFTSSKNVNTISI